VGDQIGPEFAEKKENGSGLSPISHREREHREPRRARSLRESATSISSGRSPSVSEDSPRPGGRLRRPRVNSFKGIRLFAPLAIAWAKFGGTGMLAGTSRLSSLGQPEAASAIIDVQWLVDDLGVHDRAGDKGPQVDALNALLALAGT